MNQINRWETWGAVITIIIGALLHYVYDWSGQNSAVAIFGAVNESTWEHLKIAFWPTFFISLTEWIVWGHKQQNFYLAALMKLVSTPIIIIGLFYGWLLFYPDNLFWDIGIFILAIIISYFISLKILLKLRDYHAEFISFALIIILLGMFSLFTSYPPRNELFKDPNSGQYGITLIDILR